eukprot:CAMPEP_0179145396 /NCGR_PEP_ID=MMETSP0796-20121207/70142_1 /TAXON_ID=73915 /ORGANISM="Pyrodinium bahamense, Strain pbaha01" /LENGTH=32 /DNA_ID= /DNA_START= /DNA_END= /DNA_ORIENTATION=
MAAQEPSQALQQTQRQETHRADSLLSSSAAEQ